MKPMWFHPMYNDIMDELEYAAPVGFDSVCLSEHHSTGYNLQRPDLNGEDHERP